MPGLSVKEWQIAAGLSRRDPVIVVVHDAETATRLGCLTSVPVVLL